MKKKVFSLMMTLLLAFMGVAKAEVLTVHDGTTTNSYVPFYGLWVDDYTRSEMIYPAAELAAMSGADINSLTFYKSGSSTTSSWGVANFQVYLKEVPNTTLSAYIGMTDATIVYDGAVNAAGGEIQVTINFTAPYHYNGGNLLVGIYETYTGSYSSAYWYGESVTGASASGYNGSNPADATFNQRDFLPKASFDYTAGGGDTPVASVIYDFEDSTMQGWTAIDADGDGYNWVLGSQVGGVYLVEDASLAGSGNNASNDMVCSGSYSNMVGILTPDNYLVSPQVTLGGSISFYACAQDANYAAEHFGVFVSTTGTNPSDFTMVNEWTIGSRTAGLRETVRGNRAQSTWTEYNADLSAYSGQGYVAIRHFNCSDQFILDIDDIAITEPSSATASYIIDFEEGALPDGWTVEGPGNWHVGVGDYSTATGTHSGSYNALITHSSTGNQTYLVSPMFDFSTATEGTINCWFVNRSWAGDIDYFGVYYRVNGGAWQQLYYTTNAHSTWTEMGEIQLTGFANNYQIGFLMHDKYGYGVGLDDVEINVTMGEGGPIAINDIRIEGYTAPVMGALADFDVNVPAGAHYTITNAYWFSYIDPEQRSNRDDMTEGDSFDNPNLNYSMNIEVEPEEGYYFSDNARIYINNSESLVDPEYTSVSSDYASIWSIEYHVYAEGLHTLAAYGDYNYIDQLVIERPNGAWMEPYHFNLYNDGDEDVEVVLIDFLHNNGYFSMDEETTEYPFTVAANGRPGVDLYLNTNREWNSTETIESLLAVNTTERSTHIYPIIAAPYTPYCPDVFEKAYDLGTVTEATQWREYMSTLWDGPAQQFQLHQNYDMPDFAANIPDGYDAVMKFKVDRAMSLNASVVEGYQNGKVALYTEDFYGQPGPMADNNYTERPMQGGGSTPAGGAFEAVIGNEASTSTFNNVPYYNYYKNSIGETLYTAAELQAAGVGRAPMTSLSWYASSVNGYTSGTIQIWMANVSDAALTTTSHLTSGMTKVFSGNITPVMGWNEFVFNQGSFAWDGSSNVLICVLHNDTDWHSGLYWKAESSLGFNASAYDYDDYDVFNTTTNTYSLYTSTSRSIIKMKGGNRDNRETLTYDFTNDIQGWTTIDADGDGENWYHNTYETQLGHDGMPGMVTSASYLGEPLTPDNYLVSPQVALGGTISFWANAQDASYAAEKFGVAVSTTGNTNAANFTTLQSWTLSAKGNNGVRGEGRDGNDRVQGNWYQYTVDLSAYAGQTGYVAIRHFDCTDMFRLNVDDIELTSNSSTPVDPVDPVDPSANPLANFSAGPVIENLNILPGTYYLVASSTDRDYEVEIGIEELPCPQKAVVVAPVDNAEGIQPNSVTLKWLLDPNCTEYRLTFSTTYWPDDEVETHPQTILVDWTNDLAEEYTVTNLWNNTNYFWRVDQRTNGGEPVGCTTIGDIWGFTTHFNVPQNLQINPVELFEGQTATLTWNSIVDRTYRYYYIYKDDEYLDRTTVNQVNMTTYTVAASELPYNMDGYKFNVTAIYDEGESDFSNDAIVKVSGYTNETGINGYAYEQDGVTPIGGVTVTITGTDEFGHEHTYTATTNDNGYYNVQVYVGEYTVAVANKDGYQETTTTHALPFNAPHQGQVNDVNFIMDEVFYAPANVCAETVEVNGEELVKIWWDFNFYNEMVEDFETGDLSQFDWETTANYPWTITTNNPYEGTYCLKSGGAGVNNVVSDLNLTVEIPNDGILSFFMRPSCENSWDYGYFYLDGTQMASFTGDGNWGEKRYPVTEGEHTLRWSYQKDGSVNSNDDCVYLDYIRFNLLPEPPIAGDTYDFEDGTMQGWTTIDADGDGYNWDVASNLMSGQTGHDGSADFVFSQSYSNTSGILYPDNYFVSPQVQLGGQLRFYACAQDASYAAEHFGVAVSTTGNTSASAFTMVQEWTMSAKGDNNGKPVALNTRSGRAQGTWYEFNVDLSAYAGQTGYIALRHFNCSDMFYLDVDDITIADPNRGVAEAEPTRALHHYNIYRTDCYNDGPYNSENTEFLATAWVPDIAYFDVSWPNAEPGVYKWGVSAVYAGNQADNPNNPRIDYPFEERESEITWHTGCAPCIDKDMYILDGVTINVVLNSADSPEGTVVTFENTNPGEQLNHPMEPLTLDQTGYYVFPEFRKGNYNITIEKDGYFTQLDYKEIWTPMDLRYVLIEKIFNARELYVSRTGWAMWQPNGTLSNPEDDPMRHLEGYKIMCTSIDGEPIFNENTPAEQPFCQVATADLVEGEQYICKVAAIYSTGMSDYIEAVWQYEPCEHYAGVVDGVVNVEGNTISWTYPAGGDGPTPPPTPTEEATIVLSVPQDVWGDGSGYQMLIDADATAYGTIIPETGGLTTSGNAPAGMYDNFEYKIPENADGNMSTTNIIVTGSQSITVPAGTYDWCITNPTPGDRIWIASANGNIPGRYDDYNFEAGKTYTFTVTFGGQNDQVDLTITENGRALGFACNKPLLTMASIAGLKTML